MIPRDLNWIREENMGAFLSVSQGSAEEPVFMEMSWNNASPDTEPIVLVGKLFFIYNFTDFFKPLPIYDLLKKEKIEQSVLKMSSIDKRL